MLKKIVNYFKTKDAASQRVQGGNTHGTLEFDKIRCEKLIAEAKLYAKKINESETVFDFVTSFERFIATVQELIYFNEQIGIFMYPTPRDEFEKIKSNRTATVNDFIDRALKKYKQSEAVWADEAIRLVRQIEDEPFFLSLTTAKNNIHISQIKKQAYTIKSRQQGNGGRHPSPQEDTRSPVSVDYERIIQEEIAWRKAQAGMTPLESEIERIDGMDGHTFEQWCASLLCASGFLEVEVTKSSGDQGVDVLAKLDGVRYAIQCKCYSTDLGNKPIQEVYAGRAIYNCQIGSVMTNRYFTVGAKELAAATGVFLWDRDWIISLLEELDDSLFPL